MKNVLSVAVSALAVTAVVAVSATTAFAESSKKLTDDANIISDSQKESIENALENCTLNTGWDTIIYTNNNDISSSDMENYCNDYYDNHDYGYGDEKSGVMLTVDMSSREMYILTKGDAIEYFGDSRTDDLLDSVQSELSNSNYTDACDEFISTVEHYYNLGKDESYTDNSDYEVKLYDDANLLSDSEKESVKYNLKKCALATNWDIIIYTNNNDVSSGSMENYCNDYYDEHGYGLGEEKSGVMLTVDMSSREMYILTKGGAMYYFSDYRTDDLLDNVQYELSNGDYKGACDEFTQTVLEYYNVGKDTSKDAKFSNIESSLTVGEKVFRGIRYGIVFMLFGALVGVGISAGIKYNYSKQGSGANYDLEKNSSLNLTESRDQFLYKNVTYTTESSSSSSSGSSHRSSSSHHSSSSHSSHGGGGRHF